MAISPGRRPRAPLTPADGQAIVHAIDIEGATWFQLELRFGKQHNKLRAAYLAAKAAGADSAAIERAA